VVSSPFQLRHNFATAWSEPCGMRVQYFLIAFLLSMIMWVLSFDAARDAYHAAEYAHVMPNEHIRARLSHFL
jgi:hypothetical protein